MRRVTRKLSTSVLAVLLLFVAAPALAKIPFFSVTVEPAEPKAGEPVTVTVELTEPVPVEELAGLIAFYRVHDAASRANGIPVPLARVGPTTYEGQVTLPEAGEWRIVSFPDRSAWSDDEVPPGYPDLVPVTVVSGERSGSSALILVAGLLLVSLAVGLSTRRRSQV